jgi:hypothetical protein
MIGVRVSITRYLGDEPQPGIVECEFIDAHGRCWRFVQKTAIISAGQLDGHTHYPQFGVIACEIISQRRDENGREIICVDSERPWGVESVDAVTRFEVLRNVLVEWEWGSKVERPWDGRDSIALDGPSSVG